MIKQILPNLNIEYEPYCTECSIKDFTDITTLTTCSGIKTQYIRCTNDKICKHLVKILETNPQNLYNNK